MNNSFGTEYIYNIVESYSLNVEDALNTYIEHIAIQISNVINLHQKQIDKTTEVFITGGGTLNKFLIERIQHYINKDTKIVIPSKSIIEYKEAIIMAFLGLLRVLNKTNVLSSVTGAKRNSSNGCIWNV